MRRPHGRKIGNPQTSPGEAGREESLECAAPSGCQRGFIGTSPVAASTFDNMVYGFQGPKRGAAQRSYGAPSYGPRHDGIPSHAGDGVTPSFVKLPFQNTAGKVWLELDGQPQGGGFHGVKINGVPLVGRGR